jgi:hypothetical protein
MDHLHYRLNFDLNKSRQHSLKEHHKISNIPKFRKAILSAFYNISQRNFGILLILRILLIFCLDLFRSKFSL